MDFDERLKKRLIEDNCDFCFTSLNVKPEDCRFFKDLIRDEYCIEIDDVRLI